MWYKDSVVYHTHAEIRSGYPTISFPDVITDELLLSMDFQDVIPEPIPEYNPITHYPVEQQPIVIDGVLHQAWFIAEYPPEEAAANKHAAREAAIVPNWKLRFAADELGFVPKAMPAKVDPKKQKEKDKAEKAWEYSDKIGRLSNAGKHVIEMYGLTDEEADALWMIAAKVED